MNASNLAAFRLSRAAKQGLLAGETKRIDTRPQKLAAAIAWMGDRWILRKRVPRLAVPLADWRHR